jgi:PKHD-type hydroxylase
MAITWTKSTMAAGEQAVKLAAGEAVLHGLNAAREKLLQSAPEAEETAHVNAAYLNLIRMWSDI